MNALLVCFGARKICHRSSVAPLAVQSAFIRQSQFAPAKDLITQRKLSSDFTVLVLAIWSRWLRSERPPQKQLAPVHACEETEIYLSSLFLMYQNIKV